MTDPNVPENTAPVPPAAAPTPPAPPVAPTVAAPAPPVAPPPTMAAPAPPAPVVRAPARARQQRSRKSLGALALTIGIVVAGTFGAWLGRETAPSNRASSVNNAASVQVPSFGPGSLDNGSSDNGSSDNGSSSGGSSTDTGTLDVDAITEKVNPSIVNITTTTGGGQGAGTGMILTANGEVLTNNHVINGATAIQVELSNGSMKSAKVLGYDVEDDIALIKIEGVSNLPTISAASASTVRIGDPVLAVGNALGKGGTPTPAEGEVTALNQTITAGNQDGSDAETLHELIQTDAPIQPGDSGGPLFNADAKVIGVNSAASVESGFGYRGSTASEGYAITIDNALEIVEQIRDGDETDGVHVGDRGILGVSIQRDGSTNVGPFGGGSSSGSGTGAVVGDVQANSPAENAGIEAGDTIVAIDNSSITSADSLKDAMYYLHPGDKVSVTWVDTSGQRHTATVTLVLGPPA